MNLKVEYMEYEEFGSDTAENSLLVGPPGGALWQGHAVDAGSPNAETVNAELDWIIQVNCDEVLAQPANGGGAIGAWCPQRDQESSNITFDMEHEVGGGTFKFIAAYQEYEYTHQFNGLDQGSSQQFRATRMEEYSGFSTELRFTSQEGESFDYIGGLYYEDSDLERGQPSDFNTFFGLFETEDEPWTQDTETLALFGQARFHFSDAWTVIVGARWSTEEKDFQIDRIYYDYGTRDLHINGGEVSRSESRSEDKFTPSFTIQWDVSDNVNLFGMIARGHKTGGFSDRLDSKDTDIEFDEEVIDSIEVGMKSSLLDDAMSLNVTLFSMDIEGLRLSTQVTGTVADFVVGNAADSTSEGIEIEWNRAINDRWNGSEKPSN